MDKVERVARALCIGHGQKPDQDVADGNDPRKPRWHWWRKDAQVAIDEMEKIEKERKETTVMMANDTNALMWEQIEKKRKEKAHAK